MKKLVAVIFLIILSMSVSAQTVKVKYLCGEPTVFFYKIRPFISIVNAGNESVSLSGLKVRYYYTKEGYVAQKLTYDWTPITGVSSTFHDGYLEVSFSSGSLAPGAETGGIQVRIEKEGGGYFDQSNDYSFGPEILEYTEYEKVTVYQGGNLIWGVEPPPSPEPTPAPPSGDDWLHTEGNRIKDSHGNTVRLTGINWFGFETQVNGFYNFDNVNWRFALETMTERGFNLLRLPISGELLAEWRAGSDPLVNHVNGEVNWEIDGISSLTLLDRTIEYCKVLGMKIMFDMHGYARSQNESVWYESNTVSQFQTAWRWLAARYSKDDTIVAMDLFNEPHGQPFGNSTSAAKWDGSSDSNNWRKAAEDVAQVILSENPNILIMVEGIETTPMEGYTYASTDKYTYNYNWWGGNIRGAADYPINLGSHQNKLVYSPHDYGPDIHLQPWFQNGFDSQKLYNECWYPNWFYLVEENTAPVLIGEWGGKLGNANNRLWMELLSDFITDENLHHTFWSFNPNSGDTGGIMLDDWNTVDETKYNIVKQTLWKNGSGKFIGLDHEIVLGKGNTGTCIGLESGISTPTPEPTATPNPTTPPVQTATPGPGNNLGDVNGDGTVDIVDALLTAQYYVGLDPAGFDPALADTNCDNSIDIVDALLIAQFYVGLVTGFC
ncbi:MAG: cellulase family glycosylhydrolase [Spirochaetales bacterium]|nr:cellulase family glycosylhydrolase [Spirochaetales bacterium]